MTTTTEFGTYKNGDKALSVTLRGFGMKAEIVTHGASLRQLVIDLPSGPRNVVLGLPYLETYLAHGSHVGAIAGPYAGRVPFGQVELEKGVCQLSQNAGEHHVHGGFSGLGRRNWALANHGQSAAEFTITSPDGDEGYPGNLQVSCVYRLIDTGLEIELSANASEDTPINLLHHGYFNLDGDLTVDSHSLRIPTDRIIERDQTGVPTGAVVSAAPAKAFLELKEIGSATNFDQTFVLDEKPKQQPALAATLLSSSGDLQMDILTTEPQLHFYDGGKLNVPSASGNGPALIAYQGLCLEPCRSINTRGDQATGCHILKAGQTYKQISQFRFAMPESVK